MAATVLLLTRVLLLGILFTEVLGAGHEHANGSSRHSGNKNNGNRRRGNNKSHESSPGTLWLEVAPHGELLLGLNRSGTLSCAGGPQLDRVSWLYNGELAPPCDPRQRCSIQRNGFALRLGNKRRKDQQSVNSTNNPHGEFRCIGRTTYGASLRSAPTKLLYAELAEEFDESPEELATREGQVARLACRIKSVPSPAMVNWYRDDHLIDIADDNYLFLSDGLLFVRAIRLSDAGIYRCEAINSLLGATRKSSEARVSVLPRGGQLEQAPSSLYPQPSYNYSKLNGSELFLVCAASGYPRPNVSWTFVAQRGEKPSFLRSGSGLSILELKNISTEATGTYVCSMHDNHTESQDITLDVLVPPIFLKRPANQVCPNGRTARFECQAQGFPTPRIYWLKDAADITINGRRTVYDKEFNKVELAISATVPSDSGIYQCVAVNAAGEIWAAGRLQVNMSRNSPAAPISLKCEAISPVKMFISWEPPKFLPIINITAYTVHYRPVEGGKEEVSPPEPGNSTSVEVTKLLEPFTNYTFYVRLWNNHGASDQSANITCSTKASVPITAPKMSVNVISGSKLRVTWKPLTKIEAQGIVTEYKLEWRLTQHPSARVRSFPPSIQQCVLTDLMPGQQYDLRVLARTEMGWPNVSESQLGWVTVTMPSSNDLIHAQISVLNSSAIKFKWDFKSNSIFQLTSWKISLINEDGFTLAAVDLTKNVTEYDLTNLDAKTTYVLELCALNNVEIVDCIRKPVDLRKITTSDAPTALEAIPLSSNTIGVSWLAGSINGSNLFQVCYDAVHLLNESSTCTRANSTSAIFTNLKPFTLYQFRVTALTDDQDDGDSRGETVECYTNEDVPGKVEDVEWHTINSTLVHVSWREPKTINGVIQRYYVSYTLDMSKPTWNNVTVFGNKTSTRLTTLTPGKQYFVIIRAATKAGAGSPSEPIIIATNAGVSSRTPSSLDDAKPLPKTKDDKSMGIILGIAISVLSIVACLSSIYCRRRYESMRSLRESSQPLKSNRILTRNGGASCVAGSSSSGSQPAAATGNEIELAVLFPSTPTSNYPLCDTKGNDVNGLLESCAKEPLLPSWQTNGIIKDLRITENPQYKPRENDDTPKQQQLDESIDMNSTQLTTIDTDFCGSGESLNNNMGNCASDAAVDIRTHKICPVIVPVLEPNG